VLAVENALTNHTFDHQISGKYYKNLNRNTSSICVFGNEHLQILTLAACRTSAEENIYSQSTTIIVVQSCYIYRREHLLGLEQKSQYAHTLQDCDTE